MNFIGLSLGLLVLLTVAAGAAAKMRPKNVRTVWDLRRDDVNFVSPNPELEPGAF